MNIPISPEGWANMGAIPTLFAEYNSRDAAVMSCNWISVRRNMRDVVKMLRKEPVVR